MRFLILFAAVGIAWADENTEALLQKARAKVIDEVHRIPRYVCRQKIVRQVSMIPARRGSTCSALIEQQANDPDQMRFASLDRAHLDVMLTDGKEFFSWPGEHKFESSDPGDLLSRGLSGAGDFGGFVTEIFDGSRATFKVEGKCKGEGCVRFQYEVPRKLSRFVMNTAAGSYISGYIGIVEIDSRNADLLQLTVHPTYIRDPDICDTSTVMRYARAKSDIGEFMIPESSERIALFLNGQYFDNKTSMKVASSIRPNRF